MWGPLIKSIIKAGNKDQRHVARDLNVPESSFSQWIKASYPPLEFIEKICNYFGIPLWKFFAPKDIIFPDMSPQQAEWNQLFNKYPEPVQHAILKAVTAVVEGYIEGKNGKRD